MLQLSPLLRKLVLRGDLAFGIRELRIGRVILEAGTGCVRQLIVGDATAHGLSHDNHKAFSIGHAALVETEALFIEIAEQVARINTDIGASDSPLSRLQKFSIPFVWTRPLTYDSR